MRRVLLVAVLAALLVAPVARAWTWPVGGPVLQPFSFDPAHPYAAGEHRGVDIAADAGEAVLAPAAGTVTFSGTVPGSGRALTITTGDGLAVTLTHLGSIVVAAGTAVAEGQPSARSVRAATRRWSGLPPPRASASPREAQGYRRPTLVPAGARKRPRPPRSRRRRTRSGPAPVAAPPAPSVAADAGSRSAVGAAPARAEPGGGRARTAAAFGRGRRRSAAARRRQAGSAFARWSRCGAPAVPGARTARRASPAPVAEPHGARFADGYDGCRRRTTRRVRQPRGVVASVAADARASRSRPADPRRAGGRRATRRRHASPRAGRPSHGPVGADLGRVGSGSCCSPALAARSLRRRRRAEARSYHWPSWRRAEEDPRGAGVALCVGPPAPGARGGLRRAVRRRSRAITASRATTC